MCITVYPSCIEGNITVPPSKSYMQRALLAGLLSNGISTIQNPGKSNDDISMMQAIQKLGATVEKIQGSVKIDGGLNLEEKRVSAGESGLGIRLLTPTATLFNKEVILEGEGSLRNRPMKELEKSLNALGAECMTNNGYIPIRVKGPLKGGEIKLDGSLSSQFLSGLLFALPLAEKDSLIHVKKLKSRPYIDLTLDILKAHGIQVENQDYQTFRIKGNQKYKPAGHTLEGDWSNAAFLMVAAAINGNIELNGLNTSSLQGDKKVLDALETADVRVTLKNSVYSIKKTAHLKAFEFDATETPDLFPPLVCLAAYCKGTSSIKGVKRLTHKESNRAESLITEFKNAGIEVKISGDMLVIEGGKPTGGTFDSHNDHRIAMAGTITALHAEEPVKITRQKAVKKSYPHFFEDLKQLNVKLKKEK